MKLKKRIISTLVCLCMLMGTSIPAFAESNAAIPDNIVDKLNSVYMIPKEDLENMTMNDISPLLEDIDTVSLVQSEVTYVRFTENDDSTISVDEYTEDEYNKLTSIVPRVSSSDSSTSWMQMVTSLVSIDSTTGSMAVLCTWVDVPSFRLKDAVALHVKYGNVISGSGYGYYTSTYYNSGSKTKTTYFSDFTYSTWGVGVFFNLYKPDTPVTGDKCFLYTKFNKSGSTEAIDSYYFHQTVSINVNPSFSITATGISLAGSVNIGLKYSTSTGYISTKW